MQSAVARLRVSQLLVGLLAAGCGSDLAGGPRGQDGGNDGPLALDFAPGPLTDGGRPEVVGISPDAACAIQTARAERLPLDLYLMLDASYSMLDDVGGGGSKWEAVKLALDMFMRDPRAAGYGLGLQFFPLVRAEIPEDCFMDTTCAAFGPCLRVKTCSPGPIKLCDSNRDCAINQACIPLGGCTQTVDYCAPAGTLCVGGAAGNRCEEIPGYCLGRDRCEAADYATPAVPIAPLPGAATGLSTALMGRKPEGRTPLGPALAGALRHARDRMAANPQRRVAVVLASDGLPVVCAPADIAGVAALASTASKGTPAVPTFAVGVVAPADVVTATGNLKAIATAGGTTNPYVISATSRNVPQEFLNALDAIRTTTLGCEYRLPAPAAGTLDFTRVNVQYTAGNGQSRTIANVPDKAACDPARGGWYYDIAPGSAPGARPSSIIVCDPTCGELRADQQGRVDIVLGCQTIID
jgi:hypothetical protein